MRRALLTSLKAQAAREAAPITYYGDMQLRNKMNLLLPTEMLRAAQSTRDIRLIESSGVVGTFSSEEKAQSAVLEWALVWVDQHG